MRTNRDDLPQASGRRLSFDHGGAETPNGADKLNSSEDVTFLGPQLIIALIAATLVGGVAGALFRDDSDSLASPAPSRASATAARSCERGGAPCPAAPEPRDRQTKGNR
ncbi:MAG TPA: hypothetical protein VEH76_10570 [Methylocystis sp.]|nr:hypothetical protein [Methylocystis sp.]